MLMLEENEIYDTGIQGKKLELSSHKLRVSRKKEKLKITKK